MATGIRLPPSIRQPDRELDDTYEETRTTVDMDIGPARVRNKMRSAPRLFNVRWTLDQAGYHAFDIWFQETILGGEQEFDLQLLDDAETLVWYTARWLAGTYNAEIQQDGKWVVTGTIRAVGDSFAYRPPGTDELAGRAGIVVRGVAKMLIKKVLFGRSYLGVSKAQAKPILLPFFGYSRIAVTAKGRMRARPFYGRAFLVVQAAGMLATFGDPELILQFDAVTYTPPTGDDVELQFDATVYYPPHIV